MEMVDLEGKTPTAGFAMTRDAYIHCAFLIRGQRHGSITLIWKDLGIWYCRTHGWVDGEPCIDARQSSDHPDACPIAKADEMREALLRACSVMGDELVEFKVEGGPEKLAAMMSQRSDIGADFMMFKPGELGNVGGQIN